MENQSVEEDHQEEDQEIDSIQIEMAISDPQLEENIGSASYGMLLFYNDWSGCIKIVCVNVTYNQSFLWWINCLGTFITRKETRVLSEIRKRRLNKGQLVFEVDECAGRIIGEDSQRIITKGGCLVREHAKFDGTTWRNQSDLLKEDIINKCMVNCYYYFDLIA